MSYDEHDDPWGSSDSGWDWDDTEEFEEDVEEDDTIDVEYEEASEDEYVYEEYDERRNKKRTVGKKMVGFGLGIFLTGAANALINYALNIGSDD